MILIGSTSRNSGKTSLALALIDRFKGRLPVYGLKVTARSRLDEPCHRGEGGCGVCASLSGGYVLSAEYDPASPKDTARMLKQGATGAFWLRALSSALPDGFRAFMRLLPEGALVVCESNTLRGVVTPGLFIVMQTPGAPVKPSAQAMLPLADLVYTNDFTTPLEALAAKISLTEARVPYFR
jgi:hypothetical protein